MTDNIAKISEENSGEGDTLSPAVYYRFPNDFEKEEGISHEYHHRHRSRLLRYQNRALLIPGRADKLTNSVPSPLPENAIPDSALDFLNSL